MVNPTVFAFMGITLGIFAIAAAGIFVVMMIDIIRSWKK